MTTNLSGSLGTFGLDEVLSMLGMGGRTAHMEVTSAMGAGEIHLVDGHVSAASSDRGRATLLRQVVAAGDVAAADLARALEHADAVRSLVDAGIVERGFCHGVAVEQIVDALGEMLTWQEGQFAVRVGAEHVGDIGVRLPVDEAVGRGRGRADEWGRVRAALPDEQTVLSLVSAVARAHHAGGRGLVGPGPHRRSPDAGRGRGGRRVRPARGQRAHRGPDGSWPRACAHGRLGPAGRGRPDARRDRRQRCTRCRPGCHRGRGGRRAGPGRRAGRARSVRGARR